MGGGGRGPITLAGVSPDRAGVVGSAGFFRGGGGGGVSVSQAFFLAFCASDRCTMQPTVGTSFRVVAGWEVGISVGRGEAASRPGNSGS